MTVRAVRLPGLEPLELRPSCGRLDSDRNVMATDAALARVWALLRDPAQMLELRLLLAELDSLDLWRKSNEQVLGEVARYLTHGRLLLVRARDGAPSTAGHRGTPPGPLSTTPAPHRGARPAPHAAPTPRAPAPTPQPSAPVATRVIYRVATEGLVFTSASAVLLPLPGTSTPPALALVEAIRFLTTHADYRLLIAGHADPQGAEPDNQKLSEWRAKSVELFIEDKRDAWIDHVAVRGRVKDTQALLAYLTNYHGWDCDPGPIDDDAGSSTAAAVRRFQTQYNSGYGQSVYEDGVLGRQTWGALFDVLQDEWLTALEINDVAVDALSYVDDAFPTIGCGERFAAHAQIPPAAACADHRFVDLLLIPKSVAVDIGVGAPGAAIYDEFEIATLPVTALRPPPDPPLDYRHQVWVRAFDHVAKQPLAKLPYALSGPLPSTALARAAQTDERGDLRVQDLLCGEYRLEIAGGVATVASREQVEPQAMDDGDYEIGWECWPDAVRVRGATSASRAPDAWRLEPGAVLPAALLSTIDWLWTEADVDAADLESIDCECEESHEEEE
ncbi:MAG: peptidoglycan-binding protein [Planctomycetota bacterium]